LAKVSSIFEADKEIPFSLQVGEVQWMDAPLDRECCVRVRMGGCA
jgi:hypothetical protein